MNKDDQNNLEILSKLVIQLKIGLNDVTKKFNEEITDLKSDYLKNTIDSRERYDKEILLLKEEINDTKVKLAEKDKYYVSEIQDLKGKFEKSVIELREDMLKLLKKYETKFLIQDDEIEDLKKKCEMSECKICSFQSFKVHFFICEKCNDSICSNCLQVCKECRTAQCSMCLKKCKNCNELLCSNCEVNCVSCLDSSCKECFSNCYSCNKTICVKCLNKCRKCEKLFCSNRLQTEDDGKICCAKCVKCDDSISCKICVDKDSVNERCLCGKLLCFNCEDECLDCTVPILWNNDSRIFKGFHIKSAQSLPNKCLVKLFIINKGIDTTHIGVTSDSELKMEDKATENFWSICLNSGEKFSTGEYKKKGIPWNKYAVPIKTGDTLYLKFNEGEVKFLINRKEYPLAFSLDKSLKYFIYCLTHDDSSQIEIKSLKVCK